MLRDRIPLAIAIPIDPETVEQIVAALDSGSSKSAVCRTFKVARSTLNDTLVGHLPWGVPFVMAAPAR